uniref:Methionine--tRNA ligase, cytoplasmic n=1 Tax=Plectus sambesii TaxID=2011161 RepID=A0A914WXF7_9BILA
ILITSALPYVNNVPHLGNIIGCVLSGDVFSRFCRLKNYQTVYICGTDEYGTATETKAIEEGMTPKQICDKYYAVHKSIYEWFNIKFDHFGRTTTDEQTEITQDIFRRLYEKGHISTNTVDQLMCLQCERFLADRFVEGICPIESCRYTDARGDQCDKCGQLINAIDLIEPRCKLCASRPVIRSSEHLFLDLDRLQGSVEAHLERVWADRHSWSANSIAIAKSWLKQGLTKRCITRDLQWGTRVPLDGFEKKVFYVWFDAPIGYLSITKTYAGEHWDKWWKNPDNVECYNFVGKDNVAFHAVMFPASQVGADDNYTIVRHLCATEYLNYENAKFSKSRGTGVFGDDARKTGIPADVWRFYLLYIRPETQDTQFCWTDFALKVNTELLNNLGNLVHRSLNFLATNFDHRIPEMNLNEADIDFLVEANHLIAEYGSLLDSVHLRDGLSSILRLARLGNQYIQSNKPWALLNESAELRERAGTRQCGIQPESVNTYTEFMKCLLPTGHLIGEPKPLFKKMESSRVEELRLQFNGATKKGNED